MERRDFQRILAHVDTLHDFKPANRGNLSKEDDLVRQKMYDQMIKTLNEMINKGRQVGSGMGDVPSPFRGPLPPKKGELQKIDPRNYSKVEG